MTIPTQLDTKSAPSQVHNLPPSHRPDRRNGHRRFVMWSLTLILLFTIPLCLFVFFEPPKIMVLWWTEDYDQSSSASNPKLADESVLKAKSKAKNEDLPKVLLISYDGFKWDYIQKNNNTPTFRWLIANGVFATEGLKNTYITITAPNHYAIVTGLYEESHGIVANEFLAPEYNETIDYFNQRTKTDPRVFGGEPIWVTNDKAGPERSTGCQMWTGCDIVIKGRLPKYYTSWDGDLSWIVRVDSVINWFKDPVDPINLGLLYIEEPDETGHEYGPDDPKTAAMVQKLDQLTSYLLWRLYSEDLLDKVNLIFTADHGMAAVPYANVVNLDQYVNRSLYTVYGGTPNWNVLPVPGAEQQIYDALYNKVPHLIVYNKTTIPEEFHYTNTPHVLPLQFVADLHWRLAHNDTTVMENAKNGKPITYERKTRGKTLKRELEISNATVGEHGYNNSFPDMHPYFIAYGPAFKNGYNVTQFQNLDIYPLMCHILGVDPAPNNGSFDRVKSILRDDGDRLKARFFLKKNGRAPAERPPWMQLFENVNEASTTNEPKEYGIKVVRHYLPFTYSMSFDFFIMIMLLLMYVSMMVVLSQRIRSGRHQLASQQYENESAFSKSPCQPVTKTDEKCTVINLAA